jgi:tRNA threonylcarbamoyladenosine modification (KEOPS) complex  Pcc1 subunit
MKAQAVISLKFGSERDLGVILRAISPEAAKPATSRSHVRIARRNSVLTLKFEAKDTSALRAIINSYMHWIKSVTDTFSWLEAI